ncbi:MAG TPA: YdcF family protein [Candidatus Binatia bacterium]|nr:YdcF family protein [Candidatus Binatia bacterium]
MRDLLRLGVAAALGLVLVTAYTTYRIWEQGSRDERRPAGAIVVLGAAQYDGRPSPVFRARLDHAIRLWQEGWAPILVLTGGRQPGDRTTEAAVGRAYAIARGVAPERILFEDEGRTTLESLRSVARLLRANGIRDAIFVSDPTHMLRVLRIARDEGVVAWGSPTPTSPIERDPERRLRATLHELAALGLYFLFQTGPTEEEPPDPGDPSVGGSG